MAIVTPAAQTTVLVVDDEPLAVERLQILCAQIDGVQLVGTASEGAAAITGQVLYVDGGYQIMGM